MRESLTDFLVAEASDDGEPVGRVRGPLRELVLVFDGHPEHLTDQGRRDGPREIGDEVHRALVRYAVE